MPAQEEPVIIMLNVRRAPGSLLSLRLAQAESSLLLRFFFPNVVVLFSPSKAHLDPGAARPAASLP